MRTILLENVFLLKNVLDKCLDFRALIKVKIIQNKFRHFAKTLTKIRMFSLKLPFTLFNFLFLNVLQFKCLQNKNNTKILRLDILQSIRQEYDFFFLELPLILFILFLERSWILHAYTLKMIQTNDNLLNILRKTIKNMEFPSNYPL